MIVITNTFAGILDTWLASLGLDWSEHAPRHERVAGALSQADWTAEVHRAIALCPGTARGLAIGAHVQLKHAGALGYLMVNSRTLGELFDTYLLLEKWFYGEKWGQLSVGKTTASISWDDRFGAADRLVEQLHVMALVTLVRNVRPSVHSLLRVDVLSAAEGEARAYQDAFGCPVFFSQPLLRLAFDAEAMHAPIVIKDSALSPVWRNRQRTLREAMPNASTFVQAVQDNILYLLPGGAPVDAVAARLNLSRRTLQRRLADSGCTYRQLLEGIRQRHARHLLDDAALTLKEVAFLLGYAEQSAFNHAFKHWHQTAPRQCPD